MADAPILGIDVSEAQSVIAWSDFDVGAAQFVIAKATEGASYVDPQFAANWRGARHLGLIRGAYHFGHLDGDPVLQARHALSIVGPLGAGDLPLVLDLEAASGSLSGRAFSDWLLAFLREADRLTGRRTILYIGGPFFESRAAGLTAAEVWELSQHPLWLAAYVRDPARYIPTPWKLSGWTFWQRSGDVDASGARGFQMRGISTVVDQDLFSGSLPQLRQLAGYPSSGSVTTGSAVAMGVGIVAALSALGYMAMRK